MIGNLTVTQIIFIIIIAIIIIWIVNSILSNGNSTNQIPQNVAGFQQVTPSLISLSAPQSETHKSEHLQNHPSTPYTLYYFYSPTCGYCVQFWPAWNDAVAKLKNNTTLSLKAIDGTKPENEELTVYYNISAYPTIVLVTPDKIVEYTGNRTSDDLQFFVSSNLNYANPVHSVTYF